MATADLLTMDPKKSADRQKALDSALAQIERQFGKGSIMKLGGDSPLKEIEAVSTGSLGLDIALGIGGLPKGRIIEIYGPESSGQDDADAALRRRGTEEGAAYAPSSMTEHAARPDLCTQAGVNLEELLILAARYRRAGRSRSPTRWSGRARSAWWWWIRLPRAHPQVGARRGHGRCAGGRTGAPDEPGDAQAHGIDPAARTAW